MTDRDLEKQLVISTGICDCKDVPIFAGRDGNLRWVAWQHSDSDSWSLTTHMESQKILRIIIAGIKIKDLDLVSKLTGFNETMLQKYNVKNF